MSPVRLVAALLGSLALVAGVIAYAGRADPGLSGGAAAIAAGSAAISAVILFVEQTRWDEPSGAEPAQRSQPEIRTAFRSGPLGRQSIIARVHVLERAAGTGGPLDSDTERALLYARSPEFLDWVEDRIHRLEETT